MEGTVEFEFIKPVDFTCGENEDKCSKFGARKRGYHHGIDYSVEQYTSVKASEDGVVIRAAMNDITPTRKKAYGNVIVIDHTPDAGDDEKHIYSLYGHLEKMSVKRGEVVTKDKKIGESGNTGTVYSGKGREGYHLHFEIIESSGRMEWYDGFQNDGAMGIEGGVNCKDPEDYLGFETIIEYTEEERELTKAERVKFGERLRIVRKRNRWGRPVSDDVWIGNRYAGRFDERTGEIRLYIPASELFALIDGPKPMKRPGDADFDVKV
jgi:hypothetical protein